jgi:hypothetical protein
MDIFYIDIYDTCGSRVITDFYLDKACAEDMILDKLRTMSRGSFAYMRQVDGETFTYHLSFDNDLTCDGQIVRREVEK